MGNFFIKIFWTILLFASQLLSQQFSEGSPEWLVDMFFAKSSFPDKGKYYANEMLKEVNELTIGEELQGRGEISFHKIMSGNFESVYAVEVKTEKKIIDFYCYLVKQENDWKINAIRRFLLPSFIYTAKDSMAELYVLPSNDSTFFLSLQLFTMTDSELKNYLKSNLDKFNKLITAFNNGLMNQSDILLASIGCNAIYNDEKFPGCIFIQILKFQSMEAGFVRAADAILLPAISADEYIYIEAVLPGWYVYRIM